MLALLVPGVGMGGGLATDYPEPDFTDRLSFREPTDYLNFPEPTDREEFH